MVLKYIQLQAIYPTDWLYTVSNSYCLAVCFIWLAHTWINKLDQLLKGSWRKVMKSDIFSLSFRQPTHEHSSKIRTGSSKHKSVGRKLSLSHCQSHITETFFLPQTAEALQQRGWEFLGNVPFYFLHFCMQVCAETWKQNTKYFFKHKTISQPTIYNPQSKQIFCLCIYQLVCCLFLIFIL